MAESVQEAPYRKMFTGASLKKFMKFGTLTTLAFTLGWIHYKYVSTIYENVTHFSHLSETEREMSFYSESAFYYSFYKTLVEERPFIAGISKLMYDQNVEYPNEVNALNRFNIHPEVIIASLYHYFEPWISNARQCHTVHRSESLAPVESCVGIGQPIIFYLEAIWWLAALTLAALFLHATVLSESILGGLLAAAQYFANHAECTRVQWRPNQRENMAIALLILQSWLLSVQLRVNQRSSAFTLQVTIFFINCLCLLFWQFTQFIFLTQIAIFFVMEQLRIINGKTLCMLLHSHFCGLHMAVLLLNGNDMLKSSLYTSLFIVVSTYSLLLSNFRIKVQNCRQLLVEAWLVLLRICIVLSVSIFLKKTISDFFELQEDSHIWDIFYSKFTDYKTFHSLIYTCSEEFDFLPWSSVKNMMQTFLIPFACLGIFNVCNYWVRNAINTSKQSKSEEKDNDSDTEDSGIENTETEKVFKEIQEPDSNDNVVRFLNLLHVDPAIFYNVSQLFVYGIMAALVMRLKLLFTTQLCVVASLMMNTKYYLIPKTYKRYLPLFWALCLLPLAYKLRMNTSEELSYIDEYSNPSLEDLLSFIRSSTSERAAFAGTMPTLAIVLLNTRRPIVAHPHYEHLRARQQAYSVMKTYGRFPSHELYEELSKLKAVYLIVEHNYCYGKSSNGCSFADIWDVESPALAHRPRLCHALLTAPPPHFYQVFANDHYSVFWIHDVSVRYMPRSFDS